MSSSQLENWMRVALRACEQGLAEGQSPFGAAIIDPDGQVVCAEYNRVDANNDPSAHAEVLAIRAACEALATTTLEDHWLVATGEPCVMCASVALTTAIRNVAFGADCRFIDSVGFKTWGITCDDVFSLAEVDLQLEGYILRQRCEALLREARPSRSI
ncbi:nucleoside deaminase [Roseimaritima ulvae]|uniref:tRNA-specific adenosine deaminase n=1 Tax=Roseimaritima ulvae TaxID=980254 RepID=A0A5B9QPD8_9BACT|nr:nucleoside deaminase [Roseimaritima ulvae]QEG40947.1 tRNA-specific adenosine deaminase [Roseimaritima ulvae]